MVQALGTLILLWLPGTSWRPFSMFSSASLNLTCLVKHHQIWGGILSCEIKPVAKEEEPHSQSWAGSRCPWCLYLQSKNQRCLQISISPHQTISSLIYGFCFCAHNGYWKGFQLKNLKKLWFGCVGLDWLGVVCKNGGPYNFWYSPDLKSGLIRLELGWACALDFKLSGVCVYNKKDWGMGCYKLIYWLLRSLKASIWPQD